MGDHVKGCLPLSRGGRFAARLRCLSFAFGASCARWQEATERKTHE